VQVLVAPAAFDGALRASQVAAAIGQGLESAGLEPPDLCPVADGGAGTIEVLLTRLGGETAAARVTRPDGRPVDVGFALLDGGSTALVEAAAGLGVGAGAGVQVEAGLGFHPGRVGAGAATADPRPGAGTWGAGELILAGVEAGAEVVIVAAGGRSAGEDRGAGAIAAIEAAGGLRGTRLIVLGDQRPADGRDGLAAGLARAFRAELRAGAGFVLEALEFDTRMRAARALVVGERRLDRSTLDGRIVAELAIRARQAGVPAHAIVGVDALDRFDARILDLQEILTGSTREEIVAAGRALAARL
jgi:glycerate kinase